MSGRERPGVHTPPHIIKLREKQAKRREQDRLHALRKARSKPVVKPEKKEVVEKVEEKPEVKKKVEKVKEEPEKTDEK